MFVCSCVCGVCVNFCFGYLFSCLLCLCIYLNITEETTQHSSMRAYTSSSQGQSTSYSDWTSQSFKPSASTDRTTLTTDGLYKESIQLYCKIFLFHIKPYFIIFQGRELHSVWRLVTNKKKLFDQRIEQFNMRNLYILCVCEFLFWLIVFLPVLFMYLLKLHRGNNPTYLCSNIHIFLTRAKYIIFRLDKSVIRAISIHWQNHTNHRWFVEGINQFIL